MLQAAGYGEWTRIESLERVREIFLGVLGEERLGISKAGFHQAVHRLADKAGRPPAS